MTLERVRLHRQRRVSGSQPGLGTAASRTVPMPGTRAISSRSRLARRRAVSAALRAGRAGRFRETGAAAARRVEELDGLEDVLGRLAQALVVGLAGSRQVLGRDVGRFAMVLVGQAAA